jgi:hypothetical protein
MIKFYSIKDFLFLIKIDIFIFFIINRRKYIFKNILNNISGFNIKNFIFYNIYMIERFYINIISKICFKT